MFLWRDADAFGNNTHTDWSIPLVRVTGLGKVLGGLGDDGNGCVKFRRGMLTGVGDGR